MDPTPSSKSLLPWIVATALFMEQLDSTIVNTAVPAMAENLHVEPLSLKAVVASYIISLAVGIPISGWLADRYGTRRVFSSAIALFTLSSILCGLSLNVTMLVAARVLQGFGAAMMMPVGRLAIIRTFPKSELLHAMNFVVVPALIGPLLGPTVGGFIVHWLSWRYIFYVNVPIGALSIWLAYHYMPDYRGSSDRPLDLIGLALFGGGTALLSWLLEIFGEHRLPAAPVALFALIALAMLGAYWVHARRVEYPLLKISLLDVRTFRISVIGGFLTRLGIGGLPFLMPLLYQLGLGLPAWQSGLLMMPTAAAAMTMKAVSETILQRLGYRTVLIVNTVLIGLTILGFTLVGPSTPLPTILAMAFCLGLFNSLQFSAINSLAYADISDADSSMASTMASSFQQMSLSFGMAVGALIAGWYLGNLPQSEPATVASALHHAYFAVGIMTILSSVSFWSLRANDGDAVAGRHKQAMKQATSAVRIEQ